MGKRRGNDEGSFGKRKDGTHYGTIQIDGKRHWVYGETRKEVVEKIKVLRQKAEQGIQPQADKITLSTFLDRWLEEVVSRKNKYSTYTTYKQTVEKHIKPALGSLTLAALHPDKVQAVINGLVAADKAPRTIRNVRAVLRKALNQAVRWRYIAFNAAALVEIPRIEQHKIEPLTKQEARQFLDIIKGHRLEVLSNIRKSSSPTGNGSLRQRTASR